MGTQEAPRNEENRIIIPKANWHIALAGAVRNAVDSTIIVVDSEAKKELALSAAERMNKQITVEIEK